MATVIVLNIKNKQTLSLMSQIPNKSMAYEKPQGWITTTFCL